MFESYLSDTEILGVMTICAETGEPNPHWTITMTSNATAPFPLMMTSRYHNDVTGFQDNIGFQILTLHNVLIGYGNHHLLRFSLPIPNVAKDMNIITRCEERKPACVGYSLKHTCERL